MDGTRGLRRFALAMACALVTAACAAPAGSSGGPAPTPPGEPLLVDTVVQSGLTVPWDLAFAPDGRMFVTERPGAIRVFASGVPNAPRVASFTVPNVRAMGEAGLMGIALDPDFTSNGLLYVCASRTDEGEWRNQVLRYKVAGNAFAFDRYVIRTGMHAAPIHDGCRVRFGPDGLLWVTMGDASNGKLAQDVTSLNGKVLRVNGDGSIPPDNPILPGAKGRTAIYTWGNRNPQGLVFEPGTERVIEVEHGPADNDEINLLAPGKNYGWPQITGRGGGERGFEDPMWSSGNVTYATSGAAFVTGPEWGAWSGSLFVATLKEEDLRRFTVGGDVATERGIFLDGKYGRLRTAVAAPDGSLYLTTSNGSGDRIIRVAPKLP